LLLLAISCKPAHRSEPVARAKEDGAVADAVQKPAVRDGSSATAGTSDREPGGRPVSWWQERLTTLHRDGPAELYELGVQRARANGLVVAVGAEGAVTVRVAPEARKP
jgi:hypothetical protein